jgi:hypothetical protein
MSAASENGDIIIYTQTAHRSVLSSHSGYFAHVLRQLPTAQDGTDSITLEDVHPECFGILLNWMYSKKVESKSNLIKLMLLWELGERFGIPAFQNSVMNHMVPAIETYNTVGLS